VLIGPSCPKDFNLRCF